MRAWPIAVIAVFLAWTTSCAAQPVITLRSDVWCPYNCQPGAARPGYAIEIAREVFGAAGYAVNYQLLNWTRSIEDARLGYTDAVIGAYATDVPGFVLPREPIGRSSAGFAVARGVAFTYVGPQSLDGRVIGIVADYEFSGALGAYLHALHGDRSRLQPMPGDGALAKNLAKLTAGRLDVVIDDSLVLASAIADGNFASQVSLCVHEARVPVYIAFSPANPRSPQLAAILTQGIARLRASGRLAAILARYGVRDWH